MALTRRGPAKKRSAKPKVYSIFGQINSIVADAMIKEGWVTGVIKGDAIPESVRYNEHGERAHCALVLSKGQSAEFDRRVRELRA